MAASGAFGHIDRRLQKDLAALVPKAVDMVPRFKTEVASLSGKSGSEMDGYLVSAKIAIKALKFQRPQISCTPETHPQRSIKPRS